MRYERARAIFGRSYAAEPHALIERLRKDEAITEADTLLLTVMGFADSDPNAHLLVAAFRDALAKLGWSEENNLRVEQRWGAGDPDRMRKFATE
jgi:hypothetical protein